MILDLLLISIITCFIIDISGISENMEWYLSKWLGGKVIIPKPFSCSLCSIFWIGLIWIITHGQFTLLNIVFVCLFATLSEQISNFIKIFKQLVHWVQDAQILLKKNGGYTAPINFDISLTTNSVDGLQ